MTKITKPKITWCIPYLADLGQNLLRQSNLCREDSPLNCSMKLGLVILCALEALSIKLSFEFETIQPTRYQNYMYMYKQTPKTNLPSLTYMYV